MLWDIYHVFMSEYPQHCITNKTRLSLLDSGQYYKHFGRKKNLKFAQGPEVGSFTKVNIPELRRGY